MPFLQGRIDGWKDITMWEGHGARADDPAALLKTWSFPYNYLR